ncbi:MAG: cyclase family protein [Bacillota bacterium]|nr:cyclase family protein [Bacillota bacterium]
MARLVDLTQSWGVLTPTWPYFPSTKVTNFHSHHRDGLQSQIIETNMHSGTHVDAPQHFNPRGWWVHEIPLDRLYRPTVVVDLSPFVDDYTIVDREMFLAAAAKAPAIQKGDAVILYYNWHRFNWEGEEPDETRYFCKCPGPSVDLVTYLLDEVEAPWIGADAPSVEHPLWTAIRNYRPDLVEEMEQKFGRPIEELLPRKHFLQSHRRTAARNVLLIENIGRGIDQIVNRRVTVGAFPWKFFRGESSICRLVAFLDD